MRLAALGLVASSLFALRYGVSRTLDLRAPLARILMENFGVSPTKRKPRLRKDPRTAKPDAPKPIGLTLPEGDPNSPQQLDPAPDSALDTVGIPRCGERSTLAESEATAKPKRNPPPRKRWRASRAIPTRQTARTPQGDGLRDGPEGAKQGKQKWRRPAEASPRKPIPIRTRA